MQGLAISCIFAINMKMAPPLERLYKNFCGLILRQKPTWANEQW
jgi:hypothetical protein